jgi:hypothetical protein
MTYRRLIVPALLGLLFLAGVSFAQLTDGELAARDDRHALLVGVTYYENLPKGRHLTGPGNDVVLMRRLLIDKLRFRSDRVVVLSEEQGKERGKDFLPTKANIAREFQRLAVAAKRGDHVVIHLSGHGSQQPEDMHSPDPEPDGLDEIFLPRDVGAWNDLKGTVTNAIIDDEVAAWLKAIRDKRASVWINFDSCHSGTMIRGGDDTERARDLDPITDLGIPKSEIQAAVDFAAKREASNPERARGGESPLPFKLAKEGGIVAIYACQPNEVTYERELPPRNKDAKVYGLLTFSICKILTEAIEKTGDPITYNELARRIHGQYIEWGRHSPIPLIEGVDRDRQVLGDKLWPGRSSIVLSEESEGLSINAGVLHGLAVGSILSVRPPPGKGSTILGHVRIAEAGMYRSRVVPYAHDQLPLIKDLPAGGTCRLVSIECGEHRLRVAVDRYDSRGKSISEATFRRLAKLLDGLRTAKSVLDPVGETNQADWLIRAEGAEIVLVPGSGWAVDSASIDRATFGPVPIDAKVGDWLIDSLSRIARGEFLKRLAALEATKPAAQSLRLDVKVTRRKDKGNVAGSIPTEWPVPRLTAYDKDRFAIDVVNVGDCALDVTALYIDSGYGIKCIYPREGESNRLRPTERCPFGLSISSKTTGAEQLVIIAVKAAGQPVDFSLLAQPTLERALERAGTRGGELRQSLETPLGKVLARGIYRVGTDRPATLDESNDHRITLVSFQVRAQMRPSSHAK